ncbi:MAG: squalene/phytoene synthase family protein [Bdellovibrionales bacterium]|nr:squalene/phytoene synthase family protein [Bdellovibrionales bacterium]
MSEAWQGTMKTHAKSFHLASLFFPKGLFVKVKALYALCRWIDDAVDTAPNKEVAQERVFAIIDDLRSEKSQMPVNQIYKANNLNPVYIEDLVDGVLSDLGTVRIKDGNEFRQYCYKVAGVVGLAMADLMGVKDPKARAYAVDLGIAMQITNICRDIKEDALNNRVYLPEDLLKNHGLDHQQLLDLRADEDRLAQVTRTMVLMADHYYMSARKGYSAIPLRVRGAIIVAEKLYRGIGLKLVREGARPLKGRTYLGWIEKMYKVSSGLLSWSLSTIRPLGLQHNKDLHKGLSQWKEARNFLS